MPSGLPSPERCRGAFAGRVRLLAAVARASFRAKVAARGRRKLLVGYAGLRLIPDAAKSHPVQLKRTFRSAEEARPSSCRYKHPVASSYFENPHKGTF
jgi:hypothetical protein